MFVVDHTKIDELMERMTIHHLSVTNYSFIGFKESINRTRMLLFVDGILYGSDMFLLNAGVKERIEREFKDLCELYSFPEKSTNTVVFFTDSARTLHLAFYIDQKGVLIRPNNLNTTASYFTYLCPMNYGCLAYDSIAHKLWFLSDHIGQEIKSFMHFLLKSGSFIVVDEPITIYGLIHAFKLIAAEKGYYNKISTISFNGLPEIVRKLNNSTAIGHCGFKDGINITNIYDLVYEQAVDDSSESLLLSEIVNKPIIINGIKEATEVVMDYNINDLIIAWGEIESMYIEDEIVCVFIKPRFNNYNERHIIPELQRKLCEIMGIHYNKFNISITDDFIR